MPETIPSCAVAAATLLVVATVASSIGAIGIAAAQTETIDADHGLATDSAIDRYETEGIASTRLTAFDLRLTVAADPEPVGLSDWTHSSASNTFVRVDYNEEIDRTVRIYLPNELVTPRVHASMPADVVHNGSDDVRMALEPAADGAYTAVTLELDGKTDAVFTLSTLTGGIFGIREGADDLLNDTTGWSLPSLTGGGAEWQYVPETALTGEQVTYQIHVNNTSTDDLTVQYSTTPNKTADEARWLPVPTCDDISESDVCRFQKDSQPNTVYLLSTTDDAPPVRYAVQPGVADQAGGIVDELASLPGRIWEDVAGVLPFTATPGAGVTAWG